MNVGPTARGLAALSAVGAVSNAGVSAAHASQGDESGAKAWALGSASWAMVGAAAMLPTSRVPLASASAGLFVLSQATLLRD